MEERTVKQKEQGHDNLGNSHVIQIAKHVKINSLLEKGCFGESPRCG